MRLFTALPLPNGVLQSLIKLREPVRGIKWQKPGQMHLTLCFLGDTSRDLLPRLKAKLNSVEAKPFSIQVDHMDVFPDRQSPRILWAGIQKSKPLMDLQRTIERKCTNIGFKAERRPFKPHITLGRVKKASRNKVISILESEKPESLFLQTRVTQFNLYRSELKSEGAVHQVVEEYLF